MKFFLPISRSGFTLVELITTMVVMAVLAGVAIPRFLNQSEKVVTAEAISALGAIKRAETRFFDENGAYWAPVAGGGGGPAQTNICDNLVTAQNALAINLTDICVVSGPRWAYSINLAVVGSIQFIAVRINGGPAGSIILNHSTTGAWSPFWTGTGNYGQGARFWPFGNG